MIKFAVWCMEFRPSKFFITVSCIDILFYTIRMFMIANSSSLNYSKNPNSFLLLLMYFIFFLAITFNICLYLNTELFNNTWNKLYSVFRIIHAMVLFGWCGVMEVMLLIAGFSQDEDKDKKMILGFVFFFLFLLCLSLYNLYLSFFYTKLAFTKNIKRRRIAESLL